MTIKSLLRPLHRLWLFILAAIWVVNPSFAFSEPLHRIPGRVEAEDYRNGDTGAAYFDTTNGNSGKAYRDDHVDIQRTTDHGGGYNVGWIRDGEWLAYTVEVTHDTLYQLTFRVASAIKGQKRFRLEIDGSAATDWICFSFADGWQTWHDVHVEGIRLPKGRHELRFIVDAGFFNINYMDFNHAYLALPGDSLIYRQGAELAITCQLPTDLAAPSAIDLYSNGSLLQTSTTQPFYFLWNDLPTGEFSLVGTLKYSDGEEIRTPVVAIVVKPDDAFTYLPGRLEAESYSDGGPGIGYFDIDEGNNGGAFRNDDVDIEDTTDDGGGYNVGWIRWGEWLAYDVYVPQPAHYRLTARLASAVEGTKSLRLLLDNQELVPSALFDWEDGWQSWHDLIVNDVFLPAGTHELRIFMEGDRFNINYLDFENLHLSEPKSGEIFSTDESITLQASFFDTNLNDPAFVEFHSDDIFLGRTFQAPYEYFWSNAPVGGHRLTASAHYDDGAIVVAESVNIVVKPIDQFIKVPGRIEAEAYNQGGEGIAYHDTTPGNTGGALRDEDVDLQSAEDTGQGYNVGWIRTGEWLAYDIMVNTTGSYDFIFRVASNVEGSKTFHLELDNEPIKQPVTFTYADGWQSWHDVKLADVFLTAGSHRLRMVMDSSFFNVNYIDVLAQNLHPMPQITIIVEPASITAGESVTLSWKSQNAEHVIIDQGIGPVEASGSIVIAPPVTTEYTATASGPGGEISANALVTVQSGLPTVTLKAEPSSITVGQSSLLTWTTQNATSAVFDNGIGAVSLNGSLSISPHNHTTYTLIATGPGGSITATAVVTVQPPPLAPQIDFSASPVSIRADESTLLSWSVTYADFITIEPSVGSVSDSGSMEVFPLVSKTYTLTATGPGGTSTKQLGITVVPQPAPQIDFSASPTLIEAGGSATLIWSTTNADTVTIDPAIGEVPLDGSMDVSPSVTTTYTLLAAGSGGSISQDVTITVNASSPEPLIEFSAIPAIIEVGNSTVLTWHTTHAETVAIDPAVGSVSINGNLETSLTETTTFTLTATGPGGTSTADTVVVVNQTPVFAFITPSSEGAIADRFFYHPLARQCTRFRRSYRFILSRGPYRWRGHANF